ncbi:adhesion G protein-coupled receptor E4P [Biomphalaria pfeifferi]|uniref:Adhesion G protein-coupled receptor E4P n=1 Tax=Biomphalaria pfeifferi TaxID=112525 RepID=A0AAD8BMJ4_BIOPF|nr:adhesion G protein-coupled receptor E4P [Biomphalaria pfeifferi]
MELELLELTSYYDIDIAIIPERSSCYGFELYDNQLAVLWVNAIVKGPNSTPRTDFEIHLLKNLLKNDIKLQMPTNQVIIAKPHAIFQGSIFAKVQLNTLFGHILFKEKAKSYWVNERGTTLKTLFVHTFKNCLLILKSIQPSTRPIHQELESDRYHYLNMNQLLVCQFISLNQSDYKMAINDTVIPPKVHITLDFRVTQIHITDSDNLFMVDVNDSGRLDVCIDLIDRKLIEPKLRIRINKRNRTKNTF